MKITRFEDIEAWKASRRLSRQIYTITVSAGLRRNSELKSQIREAADSVITNSVVSSYYSPGVGNLQ